MDSKYAITSIPFLNSNEAATKAMNRFEEDFQTVFNSITKETDNEHRKLRREEKSLSDLRSEQALQEDND